MKTMAIPLLLLGACASTPDLSVECRRDPASTRERLVAVFAVAKQAGTEGLETDWQVRTLDETTGLLFPKPIQERDRLRFEVDSLPSNGSRVRVWIRTELRRPQGSPGLRWQRAATREERLTELKEEIERALQTIPEAKDLPR